MKKWMKLVMVMSAASIVLIGSLPAAYAQSKAVSHQVTLSVPSILSISADTTSLTLAFADFVASSVTDIKTVIYTVKANNMTKTTGVISAKLDTLFTGVDLKADPGAYIASAGSNAKLIESTSGAITVTAAGVNLMDRQTISGSGKIALGSFPVAYQATALTDLSADYNPTQNLTITFADV
ncbi:MAG: hypothetical protein WCG06_06645 [Candidatus Omnitrophota bacterium]